MFVGLLGMVGFGYCRMFSESCSISKREAGRKRGGGRRFLNLEELFARAPNLVDSSNYNALDGGAKVVGGLPGGPPPHPPPRGGGRGGVPR
jgi:hypothetical protein